MPRYKIKEISQITNIPESTLRYWEKLNIIIPKRQNNIRIYEKKDILWIEFIKKLKNTNMPLKEIKKYSILRQAGDKTINERYLLLLNHQQRILKSLQITQNNLQELNKKINYYEDLLK